MACNFKDDPVRFIITNIEKISNGHQLIVPIKYSDRLLVDYIESYLKTNTVYDYILIPYGIIEQVEYKESVYLFIIVSNDTLTIDEIVSSIRLWFTILSTRDLKRILREKFRCLSDDEFDLALIRALAH